MNWIGKVKGDQIDFGEYNRNLIQKWCKEHPESVVRLETVINPVSAEMRGYYFGALIPFLKTLITEWISLTNDQIHEILKKQFNFFEGYNAVSKRKERFGQSIMSTDSQNRKAMEYIMRIGDWVSENYQQSLPDPEQFKKWRDSGILLNENE